jgi:hypothetical protein
VRYQDESDGLEYGESFEFFGSTEEPVRAAIIRVSDIVFNDMISTGLHPRPYLCSLEIYFALRSSYDCGTQFSRSGGILLHGSF